MRRSGWVPVALLGAGVAFVVDAVARGAASVALIAIIPVISGTSAEFLLGVVLLLVGILTLPLAFLRWDVSRDAAAVLDPRDRGETPSEEVGGLLLVGPVPVFFGSWKDVSLRTKLVAAIVGGALLVVLVMVVTFGWR